MDSQRQSPRDSVAVGVQPSGYTESPLLKGQGANDTSKPRARVMFKRCVESVLPGAKLRSSVVVLSVIQYIMFLVAICVDHISILNPTGEALQELGALIPILAQSGQLWRLLAPMFLHANWMHIAFAVFFQLRIGFALEKRLGNVRILLIYLLCGVFGSIFSGTVYFHAEPRVGGNVPGFGLLGVELVYLVLLRLDYPRFETAVVDFICFPVLMLLMRCGFGGFLIDQFGEIGALLCGIAVGVTCLKDPSVGANAQKVGFAFGLILLVVLWVTIPSLFFFLNR